MRKKIVSSLKTDALQPVYWIKSEVFEQGLLAANFPNSYAFSSLLKISCDAAESNKLTFQDWLNLSQKWLGIPADLGTMLFDIFLSLSTDPRRQLENTRDELYAKQNGLFDSYTSLREAPLPSFLLFLFLQLYPRNVAMTSPRHDGIWPPESATPSSTACQSALPPFRVMALSTRVTSGDDQLQFVKTHLNDMLTLLSRSKHKISFSAVHSLGFILTEGESLISPTHFASQMPFWQRNKENAVEDPHQLVDSSLVLTFLIQRLTLNATLYPVIELPTTRSSPKICWPLEDKGVVDKTTTPSSALGYIYSVSGLTKTMFVRCGQDINPRIKLARIFCNHQTTIYCIQALSHVAIFGCTNCTIVLGVVSKVVTIEHCEKIRVVCATRSLRVNNCSDIRVYCCSNTPPLCGVGNRAIELAPYNTYYPALEHHLQEAGVNPKLNYWDAPLSVMKDKASISLLPPSLFTPIAIPFSSVGATTSNPCPLSAEYTRELTEKVRVATEVCHSIRELSLKNKDKGGDLLRPIASHFRDWLISSGNLKQVLDILYYEEKE